MNTITNYLVHWLVDFEVAATLLLSAALIGLRWIRQPAQRVALGWYVSFALVLLLVMTAVPIWPRWHTLGRAPALKSTPDTASRTGNPLAVVSSAEPSGNSASAAPVIVPLRAAGELEMASAAAAAAVSWGGRLFLVGAAMAGAWLGVGWIQAVRICRRARPAPARLQEHWQTLAGGQISKPRLWVSSDVSNAVSLGILRPTILLPVTLAEQASTASLRAVLAHEMAHIRNRDLWLVGLLRGVLPVLYPQPLFWLLRHIIRSSQEAVADAVAAEGRGCDYADGLIGWMRQVTSQKRMLAVPSVGIWERPSELARRIALLVGDQFTVQTKVSPRWRVMAAILTGVLTLGLSAFTVRPVFAAQAVQDSPTVARVATNSADTKAVAVLSSRLRGLNLSADHSVQNVNPWQATFWGHVVATNAFGRLTCERLTINSQARNSADSHLLCAMAETNLDAILIDVAKGVTNHLTAGKGVYDYRVANGVTNETITFTGRPTVSNSRYRVSGTKLVWDITAGTFKWEGAQMRNFVNGSNASSTSF